MHQTNINNNDNNTMNTLLVTDCASNNQNDLGSSKRLLSLEVKAEPAVALPTKRQRTATSIVPSRRVKWASKPEIFQDSRNTEDYDHSQIWYTREEYNEFLEDRLRTVKKLRDYTEGVSVVGILDAAIDCLRGLEPFQSAYTHQDMHTKRRFHQTTILLEQLRQAKLGIRDPERFRLLVSAQSEMALMKAQELAAIDQHEVHHTVGRRGSMITNMMVRNHTNKFASGGNGGLNSSLNNNNNINGTNSNHNSNRSIPLDERIRTLQEMNARKLMQIYQQPWNGISSRFPIRRDSLFGTMGGSIGTGLTSLSGGTATTTGLPVDSMRFPLRRDSLGVAPHLLS